MMVIEFMILLGYDGQLEMGNSDMEKELFMSAVDQLKERFNINGYDFELFKQMTTNQYFMYVILESFSESTNDKARKCTHLDLCKDLG